MKLERKIFPLSENEGLIKITQHFLIFTSPKKAHFMDH